MYQQRADSVKVGVDNLRGKREYWVRGVHISAVDGGATTLRMSVLVAALVDRWRGWHRTARHGHQPQVTAVGFHCTVVYTMG